MVIGILYRPLYRDILRKCYYIPFQRTILPSIQSDFWIGEPNIRQGEFITFADELLLFLVIKSKWFSLLFPGLCLSCGNRLMKSIIISNRRKWKTRAIYVYIVLCITYYNTTSLVLYYRQSCFSLSLHAPRLSSNHHIPCREKEAQQQGLYIISYRLLYQLSTMTHQPINLGMDRWHSLPPVSCTLFFYCRIFCILLFCIVSIDFPPYFFFW